MRWRSLIVVLIAVGLGGCGGSAPPAAPKATLTSIAVRPAGGSYDVSAAQQFTATAYYSDGSSKNVTQSATWSSSNTSVATVSNSAGS